MCVPARAEDHTVSQGTLWRFLLESPFCHNSIGKVLSVLRRAIVAVMSLCIMFIAASAWGGEGEAVKKGVLMVSFGTTVDSGQRAIDSLFESLRAACPGTEVRLAYTSNIIRKKLAEENGRNIDSPMIALSKMRDEGFSDVVVVSTHIIPGEEYSDLVEVVRGFRSIEGKYGFRRLVLSEPLLCHESDFEDMAGFLKRAYGDKIDKNGAVALMGHGTPHFANSAYGQLQVVLDGLAPGFIVGTVEGNPTLDDVTRRLKESGAKRVTLVPFMVVAGDHAVNDMAGPEEDSWAMTLKGKGYRVSSVLKGLGEYDEIGSMLVRKFRAVAGSDF